MERDSINNSIYKKIFTNLFIFVIITSIFINFIHTYYQNFAVNTVLSEQTTTRVYENNQNFKINISEHLSSKNTYKIFLERDCEINGSMEDRKKVRWVIQAAMLKVYEPLLNINNILPYYFQILFFSILIFITALIIFNTFLVKNEYKFLFLFFIAFVFQNPIGEFQFSVFEMFFLAVAIYASKTKNFILFILSVILATLNRESGIIISLTWLIFNENYKKVFIAGSLGFLSLIIANIDILSCITNPNFFIPENNNVDYAQFSIKNIGTSVSYLSALKVLFINFIIPFGFSYYIFFSSQNKNKFILYITSLYMIIFIVAIPINHISTRLILIPIIYTLLYFKNKNKIT